MMGLIRIDWSRIPRIRRFLGWFYQQWMLLMWAWQWSFLLIFALIGSLIVALWLVFTL